MCCRWAHPSVAANVVEMATSVSKAVAWPGARLPAAATSATPISPVRTGSAATEAKPDAALAVALPALACSAFATSACRPERSRAVVRRARQGRPAEIHTGACAALRGLEHVPDLAARQITCAHSGRRAYLGTAPRPAAEGKLIT